MGKDELKALAERVMALAGPCIAIDADVEIAVGGWKPEHYEAWHRYQECGEAANPPFAEPSSPRRFTASLDAAMALVPEGAWWWVEAQPLTHGKFLAGCRNERVTTGATPALALTAAALLALAEQVPE